MMTINKSSKLYVIQNGNNYSCYGFEVLYNKVNKLAQEYNRANLKCTYKGTKKVYNNYLKLCKIAEKRFKTEKYKSKSNLIPEFVGHEGKRVEVTDRHNETKRFYIGRSSGFIPCHIEILKSNSSGGMAVSGYPFKNIKFL